MKFKTLLATLILSQILSASEDKNISNENIKKEVKQLKTFSPRFLSMAKTSFKLFDEYKSTNPTEAPFIEERFYPIGYSDEGEMAYILEYYTGKSGSVHIETYIQDLISDEIIWQDRFRAQKDATDVNFKKFWEQNKNRIEMELNRHHINPFKKIWLKTEPISYKSKTFSLNSDTQNFYVKDLNLYLVNRSTISIKTKERGEKIINKKEYDQSSYLLDRKAIGFIPLGHNNKRTAVVVATIYYNNEEGSSPIISYEIIGANLAMGFSK